MIITINGRKVGDGEPCYIVAEIGCNHNGDIKLARKLVMEAAKAGANAVKFQAFNASKLVADGYPQQDMLAPLEFGREEFMVLNGLAKEQGMAFFASAFDDDSVALLWRLKVPIWKIPSGEITNLPMIEQIAKKGQPIIMSTGMSTLGEVEHAVNVIEKADNHQLILLHCVSSYPAPLVDTNLRAMVTLRHAFGYPVGLSDHSIVRETAIAAVAMGASVIEKHITLSRTMEGPDHAASLEPYEFLTMVMAIRSVEEAMGTGRKGPMPSEVGTKDIARKSLVAARDIHKGEVIMPEMVNAQRPGIGIGVEELYGAT